MATEPEILDQIDDSVSATRFEELCRQLIIDDDLTFDRVAKQIAKKCKCNVRSARKKLKELFPNVGHEKDDPSFNQWYLSFEKWWIATWIQKMKYIQDWQQWVQYNGTHYEPVHETNIDRIIFKWLDENQIKSSLTALSLAKKRLVAKWHVLLEEFDADPNIRNIGNGLLNVRTKELTPHSCDYLSLRHVDVNYLEHWTGETDFYIGDKKFFHFESWTPGWDSMWHTYPKAMAQFEWFQRAMLTNHMEDELSFFGVGPRGSGKGTIANFIALFYGKSLSYQGIHLLGERFGRGALVGKMGNMDKEMTIVRWSAAMIRYYKTITGRDGQVDVEIKQRTGFDHKFDPFFFMGFTNQFPQLPGTDAGAVFRRTLIVEFDHKFKRNNAFKDNLLDESDIIFTELINIGYTPYFAQGYDLDAFIKENAELWDKWANPVRMIVDALYERDDGVLQMSKGDVLDDVSEKLDDMGYKIPSERILSTQVTQALKRLGILKGHANKEEYFRPIRYKSKERQEGYEKEKADERAEQILEGTRKQKEPKPHSLDQVAMTREQKIKAIENGEDFFEVANRK